jgi:hypothetical protein
MGVHAAQQFYFFAYLYLPKYPIHRFCGWGGCLLRLKKAVKSSEEDDFSRTLKRTAGGSSFKK